MIMYLSLTHKKSLFMDNPPSFFLIDIINYKFSSYIECVNWSWKIRAFLRHLKAPLCKSDGRRFSVTGSGEESLVFIVSSVECFLRLFFSFRPGNSWKFYFSLRNETLTFPRVLQVRGAGRWWVQVHPPALHQLCMSL